MARAARMIVRDLERLELFYRAHLPKLHAMRLFAEDFDTLQKCKTVSQLGVTGQGGKLWFHGFDLVRGD